MFPSSHRQLDFTHPFQGRKWLRLLREDPVSGIRIKANLDLPSNYLGFSFNSNRYGLRGPCSEKAKAFVIGTSYAMGFAVQNSQNWYESLLREDLWLNLGLPVGPSQWHALFKTLQHGPPELALLLYHPNIWSHSLTYQQWEHSGQPVFDFLHWKTDFLSCLKLMRRHTSERNRELNDGTRLLITNTSGQWLLNSAYSVVDVSQTRPELDVAAEALYSLLANFQRVLCVRVPIKEQMVPDDRTNDHFRRTLDQYDEMWIYTMRILAQHKNISFSQLQGFELTDFHGFDTHLNTAGNQRLRQSLHERLSAIGLGDFCLP